jgi:hypothetical protein
MIEIITHEVKMPDKKRYVKECINNKWSVFDTKENITRYKGRFEDVAIACHNLNKKYYDDLNKRDMK